ncbi:hypothetical protein ACQUQU_09290 [Thalassolituus sp. LLYu03]|uniref:hypothetical protein n=1 Tax=Thalassolituus sp. LLYu03 TaxID=3421656 RepID=UPI003D2963C3
MKLTAFLGLAFAGFIAQVAAATTDDALLKRELLESFAYRTTTEFCLVIRNSGDKAATARLNELLGKAQSMSQELAPQWPQLEKQWAETAQFVQDNQEAANQGDVVNLLAKLQIRQTELYESFNAGRPQAVVSDREKQNLLVLLDSLERMLATYLTFQTTLFGGHSVTEVSIEDQARRFDEALSALTNTALKDDISRKWGFVKETLLAYNERSAVFIVDRTGRTIRDLIEGELGAGQLAAE